jgi:DNA-binding MarR family transcriptional regulator
MTHAIRPVTEPEAIPTLAGDEERREDVRTWLQLVKAVLPMEREINRVFAREFGQSLPRFDVLAQLDIGPANGMTVGALAEQLIASAGNITHLLSRMVREGLVLREAGTEDRRSQIIRITEAGRTLYHRMSERHDSWAASQLGTLGSEDKVVLQRLLRKLRGKTTS